jgi:hydroxybutyrate-dimer hydrolase
MLHRLPAKPFGLALVFLALFGCKATETPQYAVKPTNTGTVNTLVYDGIADDLLTAGLGVAGLQSATVPSVTDAANPTVGELRRLAIYNAYRAAVDTTAAGGFGVLYGPNVDANGLANTTTGAVPGSEYLSYLDDGTGKQNVTVMVQIPLVFNRTAPCIVVAPSTGSFGVYGAVPTAGEWGLKRGCAVAYFDKGTGTGVHDLATDTVNAGNGARQTATAAATGSNFTATLTAAERDAYNAAFPNRIAVKHAHSQQNPERDWGKFALGAVDLTLYLLNQQFSQVINGQRLDSFKADNVLVIAAGVGNAGGAALAAAEADTTGLIDGVVAAMPNIQMVANNNVSVKRGAAAAVVGTGRVLLDYMTLANQLQPCAALAASVSSAPGAAQIDAVRGTARCAALKSQGVLAATTAAAQADEALALLQSQGWPTEGNDLHATLAARSGAVAITLANSYGKFGVRDNLCGFSFAGVGSNFKPAALAGLPTIFGTSNGLPATAGIEIINNNSVGGALENSRSISPTSGAADYNADGARCLRNLFTGTDANATRVASGINEVRRTGNLRGKPAVIVHGRADAFHPAAFTSRPYFALNKSVEGTSSNLVYAEVTNAQHFDAMLGDATLAGLDTRFLPMQRYFNNAMDIVYNKLRSGTALPPSQVVRPTPRGGTAGSATAITATNLTLINASAAAADQITFASGVATIPD